MKAKTLQEAMDVINQLLDMQYDAMEQMYIDKAFDFVKRHRPLRDKAFDVIWELRSELTPIMNQKVEVE